MIEILSFPFMQKALAAGIVLGAVLSFLGVFTVLKRASFFGDGIAHASLLGIALGVLAGVSPFGTALAVGAAIGAAMYFLERKTSLPSDAIVGIFFTGGMAAGIALLSFQKGYQPELMSFLFGNILAVGTVDLFLIAAFGAGIVAFLSIFYKKFALLVFDRDEAWLSGMPVGVLEFFFYVLLSVAVVLGVKLLGIILVSALLIIPPTTAKLFSKSFRSLIASSVVLSEVAVLGGIFASYYLDLPSGASIVLTAATLFFVVAAWSGMNRKLS